MYSPKIREELVIMLYRRKQLHPENKPMTWFANEAIREYLQKNGGSDATCKGMVLGPQKSTKINKTRTINSNHGG